MDWIDTTISDFGRAMNMENLSFGRDGIIGLDIEAMGSLFIERLEQRVLVYLMRELPTHQKLDYRKAMELCHYKENPPVLVNPCIKEDNQLIFLASITNSEFSLPLVEQTVAYLHELHERVLPST